MHPKAIKDKCSEPKSSTPITIHAIGVLAAAANTATNPTAAKTSNGIGINTDKAQPKVAPIKNNGVTSPPLNPAPRLTVVKINLK